jgi:hypothetical protein
MSGWRVLVKKPCVHQDPFLFPAVSNPRNRTYNRRSSSGRVIADRELSQRSRRRIRTGGGCECDSTLSKPMKVSCTMLIQHPSVMKSFIGTMNLAGAPGRLKSGLRPLSPSRMHRDHEPEIPNPLEINKSIFRFMQRTMNLDQVIAVSVLFGVKRRRFRSLFFSYALDFGLLGGVQAVA